METSSPLESASPEPAQRPAPAPQAPSAFALSVAGVRPIVTWALIAVNVAVYGLETLYGGADYAPALMRLGALAPPRVHDGEIWRLVTATFLHGGLLHLLLNMYVLLVLGTLLEKVIGSWRFLALYGAAALGGSLLSLQVTTSLSVGASGAIWGLMTAQMVLAWRGGGILPVALRDALMKNSFQNLAINIVNSLRPGVDWAAHAGGGLAGALLMVTGLFTAGLPRWAELPDGVPGPADRVPPWMRAAAVLSGAILAIGLVGGILAGRVWELGAAPTLAPTLVGSSACMVDVPVGLAPDSDQPAGELLVGDVRADPVVVEVKAVAFAGVPADERDELARTLEDQVFSQDVKGFRRDVPMSRSVGQGTMTLSSHLAQEDGSLEIFQVVHVQERALTRVDLLVWRQAAPAWKALATQIAASTRCPELGTGG